MARAVYVPAYARIPDAARRQLGRAIADALAAHPPAS
jgi:hypothetical protein